MQNENRGQGEIEPTDPQHEHWEGTYASRPQLFGSRHSSSATYAAQRFRESPRAIRSVVELGAGGGRDTVYFAAEGFTVTALDYSSSGLATIRDQLDRESLHGRVETIQHDVRAPLPLADHSVEAAYAHLLLCTDLSTAQIQSVVSEVHRILIPGGVFIYTARNTSDPHYEIGEYHGDNIYETAGYAVHFFDRALINQLAVGWELEDVTADSEGTLPRQIWRVTQLKPKQGRVGRGQCDS